MRSFLKLAGVLGSGKEFQIIVFNVLCRFGFNPPLEKDLALNLFKLESSLIKDVYTKIG